MILTTEQKDAVKNVIKEIKSGNNQVVTLGGHAGCGKTTCLTYLSKYFENFAVCAFTGQATNVLRKKGLDSNTIHGTIYKPYKNDRDETIWMIADAYDLNSKGIEGFIIDEGSFVSKEIHMDLLSFNLPIIYVGDHGQLEPIGTKFNLMEDPMYKLETIHRNAGEIAHFAAHLRNGNPSTTFKCENNVQIVNSSAIEDRHLASVDQVICAYNKTRVEINEKVRRQKRIEYTFVGKDEKIISLRNNKKQGLFNGMQGVVTKIHKNDRFDFISDGVLYEKVHYDIEQFGKKTNEFDFGQTPNPFDYAYAITAHKSQGAEFGSVIAYEQRHENWNHYRWSYTVASRAKRSLIWIALQTYIPKYLN
jgi:exodeoxyribonuclease-5